MLQLGVPLRFESDYMIPYFIILFSILLWLNLEKYSLNRKAFWVPLLLLSIFAGVRSSRVGTDSGTYTSDFRNQLNLEYFVFREDIEYGYQLLSYIILNFTHNYFWLFFISSIIVVGSYLHLFKKISKDYFLSIYIFITFGFYTFYFNGLRQGLAMAVAIWATPYLIERKIFNFSLLIVVASFFHKSALIMFFMYLIVNLKVKLEYKLVSTFLGSFFLSSLVIEYLASENERYTAYTSSSENAGGYLVLGIFLLFGIIFYFLNNTKNIFDRSEYILLQLYLIGLTFLIPVALLGTNPSGPQRLLFYFVWPITILLPTILLKINIKLIYLLFITLSGIYFYLRTSRFSNLTPYQINEIFRIF
ncbi:MAG: EpsG family protein [Acinetobacter sp.]|uniref:EpsG family protein n=1 Tax=Acinetobacter sp. TaxID=472 RepID=UPI003D038D7D